ncbi:MAG: GAF domain-containing protein [candidate division Zixibacteria bacterium]|nr:GAF domain-containing protein [candidate division Zixibacteria bacterium]
MTGDNKNNHPITNESTVLSPPDSRDLLRNDTQLSESFFTLTRWLRRIYAIDRGVLVIRSESGPRLSAISTWRDGQTRDGLSLNLPLDSSLFEKVAEHGQVYTEDFCGAFSGNFFERKLLLDDDSRSFVVQPLKSEGRVLGLLGYSSRQPTAFAMLEEGALDDMASEFGAIIENKIYQQ